MDSDSGIRAAIEEHWRASERGDIEAEHAVYAADAVLDNPQSGERFRGRVAIAAQRGGHAADRHFTLRRIVGGGDLRVSARSLRSPRLMRHLQGRCFPARTFAALDESSQFEEAALRH